MERLRDLVGGVSGGGGASAAAPKLKPEPMVFQNIDAGPSWLELEARVTTTPTAKRIASERNAQASGAGPAHTDASLRLFGSKGEPRVVFYRDMAGWCPYCQKVWLLLEEKGVPYKTFKVPMRSYGDKPASFLEKVPSGLLPAIELDGELYTESLVIMQLLEEAFPDTATLPPRSHAEEIARANRLLKLERELFSRWCTLTFRRTFGSGAEDEFSACMDKVEAALGDNPSTPWLLDLPYGGPSFVDFQYVSHVERMAASCQYWKGLDIRNNARWPRLEQWFRAFESRPQYMATKSDYYTHCQDIPPQYGPGMSNAKGPAVAAHIDGANGAWQLPLPPLTATSSPEPYFVPAAAEGAASEGAFAGEPGEVDDQAACHEAALRLVNNRDAVLHFSCRGAGKVGAKRFQAPLADPYATPSEDPAVRSGMDLLLRATVARLLLSGPSDGSSSAGEEELGSVSSLEDALRSNVSGGAVAGGVRASAAYLRDRVGVPRDMSFPAARQLRAHLNWALGVL